ncbi:methyltransferase [Mesorhizobium sp. SP-1A]|uniref:methyltransferase n=1 Tax=Mesorhizobium sp. SP-1A TaxID=3077840 RepID=UPI0028F6E28D|nr:methyltransferase [Mesorhizobium sp. SP-1A]
MKPLQASSGDVIADRRADYAEMLFATGDLAAAVELMQGALELAPHWVFGWFRLGEMQEALGDVDGAAAAWTRVLELEPADRPGATLRLVLIGRAPPADAAPSAFVEALFDQYAGTFDTSLVGKLGYSAPDHLLEAIRAQGERRFGLALDLGCGTGLMGEKLRPHVGRLEGYDLSAGMLRKAAEKGIYDHLGKADLSAFSYEGPKADLVVAADVLIYLGALDKVMATAAGLLEEGGLLAFTLEKLAGDGDFALQPSRRYAHSQNYVRRLLEANGLSLLSLEERILRQDRGEPIVGLVVVARR